MKKIILALIVILPLITMAQTIDLDIDRNPTLQSAVISGALTVGGNLTLSGDFIFKTDTLTGVTYLDSVVGNIGNSTTSIDTLFSSFNPQIYVFAGDTSNFNTPLKVGDIFIDTSADRVYISKGVVRGDWIRVDD